MYKKNSENMQRRVSRIKISDIPSSDDEATLNLDEERRVLTHRMGVLKSRITELRIKHSFHKNRSLISQIKCRFKKGIPETVQELIRISEEYQACMKRVSEINNRTKTEDCWKRFFIQAAHKVLTNDEFQNIKKLSEAMAIEADIKREQINDRP